MFVAAAAVAAAAAAASVPCFQSAVGTPKT